MSRGRRQPRPAELRERLARVQRTAAWLASHARLGRELRLHLAEAGSPTWTPAEDLSWRRWIERQGDDYAQLLLAELDAALDARLAEIAGAANQTASAAPPAATSTGANRA